MQATGIEWTDFSANLLKYRDETGKIVWHCEKISPGCAHCYSEALAHRYRKGGPFAKSVTPKVTPFFCEKEAALILRSAKLIGKKVFINDMTDLFGDWVSWDIIGEHFALFAQRQDVQFQILTKRSERMRENSRNAAELPNVWHGVSVEGPGQKHRINDLRNTHAAIRFLSIEPLIEDIGELNLEPSCTLTKMIAAGAAR